MLVWSCSGCGHRMQKTSEALDTAHPEHAYEILLCPKCGNRYSVNMTKGKRSASIKSQGFEEHKAHNGRFG